MIAFVIVAGGCGRRMNASMPKQYMTLGKMPILMHTLRHALMILSPEDKVILVVPRGDREYVSEMIKNNLDASSENNRIELTEGGDTRTDSVRNGLSLVADADIVAIHDSVRVFFTKSLLHSLVAQAIEGSIAVPVQEATDSIIFAPKGIKPQYIPRNEVLQVKTPQVFPAPALLSAYEEYSPDKHGAFTDDASLVRALHPEMTLSVVQMNFFNNKITYPMDIELASQALESFDPLS